MMYCAGFKQRCVQTRLVAVLLIFFLAAVMRKVILIYFTHTLMIHQNFSFYYSETWMMCRKKFYTSGRLKRFFSFLTLHTVSRFTHSPLFFPFSPEMMLPSRHKDGGHAVLHSHSPPPHPPAAVSERAGPSSGFYLKEGKQSLLNLLYCQMLQKHTALLCSCHMPEEKLALSPSLNSPSNQAKCTKTFTFHIFTI